MRKRNSKCMIYYSFLNWVHLWREKKKNKKLLLFHCVLRYLKSQNSFCIIPYHDLTENYYFSLNMSIYFLCSYTKRLCRRKQRKISLTFLKHVSLVQFYISLYWRKVWAVNAEQGFLSKHQFVIFISEKSYLNKQNKNILNKVIKKRINENVK